MSERAPNTYRHIDRNIEIVMTSNSRGDIIPTEKSRSVEAIENGLINDTYELVSIFDNTTRKSDHLLTGERATDEPFTDAVYLDKSARPVRRLVHNLWSEMSQGDEPEAHFINIDKRPWLGEMGFPNKDYPDLENIPADEIDINKIDPEYLDRTLAYIRALYLDPKDMQNIPEDGLKLDDVKDIPTRLDGKTVAIIDEVKSSGNTLLISQQLLSQAIPEANFEGMWWSNPGRVMWHADDGSSQFAASHVPPWYQADTADGRGVDDISERESRQSPSLAQRLGRQVLSLPQRGGPGPITERVRDDLDQLSQNYKQGTLTDYRPDKNLAGDRTDQLFERYLTYAKHLSTKEEARAELRSKNQAKRPRR